MNRRLHTALHWLAVAGLLAAVVLVSPGTALAASITGIDPNTVSSLNSTNIVISGEGFDSSAIVVVGGAGALPTTYIGPSTLTAIVPAGLNPGTYDVTVVMSTTTTAPSPERLTVIGPTNTPEPTGTPAPTAFIRPLLTVLSYGASSQAIVPGSNLDFEMTFLNSGQAIATNIVATFVTGDFAPRVTGGVRAVRNLAPGESEKIYQPLTAATGLSGVATLEVQVSYTDPNGTAYNETFSLTFPVFVPPQGPFSSPTPTPTATPTATTAPVRRPQLLITAYTTDVEQLEPGTRFTLQLEIENLGVADARRITMIAGGGTAGGDGTAVPGGVSGGGGDFSKFAPVGASNVQSLGDLDAGGALVAEQSFIVNATTDAGAYPMEFSFIYAADSGSYTDNQVITLLVYKLPRVDISLYRDSGQFFTFQPNILPLQIVNLGRSTTTLGNMRVSAEGVQLSNNVILIGNLDPGGFFTLDATVIPEVAGPLDLTVTVDYNDDFNQPRTITETITVEVIEVPPFEPGGEDPGIPVEPQPTEPESFWDRVIRFIRGLLGLDTGEEAPPDDGGVIDPGLDGGPVDEGDGIVVPLK
jgi:hypothetical protein